jgi:hypothetical protein
MEVAHDEFHSSILVQDVNKLNVFHWLVSLSGILDKHLTVGVHAGAAFSKN